MIGLIAGASEWSRAVKRAALLIAGLCTDQLDANHRGNQGESPAIIHRSCLK